MKVKTFIFAAVAALGLVSCGQKSAESPSVQPTKTLVLYYSQGGATQAVAQELQRLLGADLDSITVEEPYSGTYEETIARCQKEMQDSILPKVKALDVDVAAYDTIYLGYPIWFGSFALPMKSYLKEAKLEGKVIIPFCTFGSGGLQATCEALKKELPNSTVLPGYGVRNARVAAMPKELDRFLKENRLIPGETEALAAYGEQKPVTEGEQKLFDQACGNYQFPLGTPVTVGSRTTADGTDYEFHVTSQGQDGKESSSIIYVTVDKTGKADFTQVVRE